MSIITTLFKCLTCSLGPRIWKRIKKKTNFSHWPLRRQVVVAASLQLFCVLILFLITMGLFVHLIYSSSQKKLEEARQKYEWKACEKDIFIQKRRRCFFKNFKDMIGLYSRNIRNDYYERKISGIMKEKKKEKKKNRKKNINKGRRKY